MKIGLTCRCVPLGGLHTQTSAHPRYRLKKEHHSSLACWTREFNWGYYRNICRGLRQGTCVTCRGFTTGRSHPSSQQLLLTYLWDGQDLVNRMGHFMHSCKASWAAPCFHDILADSLAGPCAGNPTAQLCPPRVLLPTLPFFSSAPFPMVFPEPWKELNRDVTVFSCLELRISLLCPSNSVRIRIACEFPE